jgi:glycosyltransferase involved in cell wall biosynthesis
MLEEENMISVIITTKDQAHQVEACIRRILEQDFDGVFEIIAIDDGSRDGTVSEINRLFGMQVKTIEQAIGGWLPSLLTACSEAKGEVFAVCDPHCTVRLDWLQQIERRFREDEDLDIMTGPALHGKGFMGKLCAFTIHSQFSSLEEKEGKYIFDDNFAVRRKTLSKLLASLPLDKNLNDGVGCALLSSQAKQHGIPILYDPSLAAVHVTPDFFEYLHEWKVTTAENTIDIRLLDPTIRGAGILKHLSLAPFIYPIVRVLLDVGNAWRLKKVLSIAYLEIPFLLMADLIGKMWYCAGLVSVVRKCRKS